MSEEPFDGTRRELLKITAATGGDLAVGHILPAAEAAGAVQGGNAAATQAADAVPTALDVVLRVNGTERRLTLDPRTTLLDALREHLHLTGSKKGCGLGQCGACTVLMDGKRMKSCLWLAALVDGRAITTIEGLAQGESLHPLQVAFIERDGFQCGYCTSGQIMAGVACIDEGHAGSAQEIRDWMSGNLCRCGAYDHIVAGYPGRGSRHGLRAKGGKPCTPSPLNVRATLIAALALRAQAGRNDAPAEYIAGGTDMVQLLQEYVRRPGRLVSLAGLLDNDVDVGSQGLRLGAAATMADVAAHPDVVEAVSRHLRGVAELGEPAGAQPGHHGRQPRCSAPGVPIFATSATQLATSARRARAAPQSAVRTAGMPCSARARTASPRTPRTSRSRWLRSTQWSRCRASWAAHRAARDVLSAARRNTPHLETVLEPGEVIAAITVPASAVGAALALPQGARSRLV